jgi:hypothetical protein
VTLLCPAVTIASFQRKDHQFMFHSANEKARYRPTSRNLSGRRRPVKVDTFKNVATLTDRPNADRRASLALAGVIAMQVA